MGKFLSFVNYKRSYNYLIYSMLAFLFYYICNGINYYDVFEKTFRLFPLESQNKYEKHFLVRRIICYFGTTILSLIFYTIGLKSSKISSKIIEDDNASTRDRSVSRIVYIHKKQAEYIHISYSFFILMMFLWVLLEQVLEKFYIFFPHMDFWMIELIIITFLTKKLFNTEIYRHHVLVLAINCFSLLFKIITIILSFIDQKEKDKEEDKEMDKEDNVNYLYVDYLPLLIVGPIIYLILITSRAYVNIQLKRFMDLKYISPNKLLFNYGLIGTLFDTALCIFTTFVKCDNNKYINKICNIENEDKNNSTNSNNSTNDKYFQSFDIYFKTLYKTGTVGIIFEILTNFFAVISFYFYKYFFMQTIKFLTPVHIMFISPVIYLFLKLLVLLYNSIWHFFTNEHIIKKNINESLEKKIILDFLGDIFSIIGFLIYLEIVQLSFCGLDYNLRNNIIERSEEDTKMYKITSLDDSLGEIQDEPDD